ncbi:MAG: hypothetical protein M0R30_11050 [Methanoregula sp.]|uniref:hypothetical protein n=1 Tax=Methanoregula sp. TaxID=2052170 RepID=UPI0025D1B5E7|nr:hypothetical protein [Methanoregula sp.]MCK9632166.1 hypothetical protein [Methanoregula sp.]
MDEDSPSLYDSSEVALVCDPDRGPWPEMFGGMCGKFFWPDTWGKKSDDAGKILKIIEN